jgi:hypothetical protein
MVRRRTVVITPQTHGFVAKEVPKNKTVDTFGSPGKALRRDGQ